MSQQPLSFTITANGLLAALVSECAFSQAHDPRTQLGGATPPQYTKFQAIWDTGATGSVISQRVIDVCGLQPISIARTRGVGGFHETEAFLVNIGLPNHVAFANVSVIRGELDGFDALIGMNIIQQGDFAVTNKDGKTVFTFRMPSCECIDFVKQGIRTPWGVRKLEHGGRKQGKKHQ